MKNIFILNLLIFCTFIIKGQSTINITSNTTINIATNTDQYIISNNVELTINGSVHNTSGKFVLLGCNSKLKVIGSFTGNYNFIDIERHCDECTNLSNFTYVGWLYTNSYLSVAGNIVFTDVDCQVPLPVELISFDVKKRDGFIEVNWITGSEINNSHFEILVSNNGTDWEPIQTVIGMGTTHDLTYYYETVQTNKTYFKLKQVDYDGTTSYSKIKYVSADEQPIFNSTLNYIYISNLHGDVINFYNVEGQLVNSINYDGTSVVINKSTLNTGFYIVRIGELSKKVYIYPN